MKELPISFPSPKITPNKNNSDHFSTILNFVVFDLKFFKSFFAFLDENKISFSSRSDRSFMLNEYLRFLILLETNRSLSLTPTIEVNKKLLFQICFFKKK
jgi:hypothetical protein